MQNCRVQSLEVNGKTQPFLNSAFCILHSAFWIRSVLPHELRLDSDSNLVADQHAARFQCNVPLETEIPSIDRRRRAETRLGVPPGIGRLTFGDYIQRRRMGDSTNCQLAIQGELRVDISLEPGSLELDRRVLIDVQEIGRPQVSVTLWIAGSNAGSVDRHVDFLLTGSRVKPDRSAYSREAPLHVGDH
jgi:hypothetical protein